MTHTDTTCEATRTPTWGRIALVSFLGTPLAVVVAALVLLAVAPGWAKMTPDGGSFLTLVLAGVGGGLVIARTARAEDLGMLLTPLVGAIVAVGFHEWVLADSALEAPDRLRVLLGYVLVQATASFLATWLSSRR